MHPLAQASDAEFIASLGLDGEDLTAGSAQAARMLKPGLAETGTPLTRTSGGGPMTVDMRRARGVALDLAAMPHAEARAVLERRKAKVGARQFAAEARLLAASLQAGPPARRPGDVRTVTDVAAQVPRGAPIADPNDPTYAAVLAQSGVRSASDRFPNADAARRNTQSGW